MRKNIIRFLVVGAFTTAIDWTIYLGLSRVIHITFAKVTSMLLASFFSYVFNKRWTFQNKDKKHEKYIWRYYITFLINVVINTAINTFVYGVVLNKFVALVVATGCATVVNFILQRFWVFDEKGCIE